MVLRCVVHIHYAVGIGVFPQRIVGRRAARFERAAAQTGVDVRPVADIQAVAVGQFVKPVVLRVIFDPDAVDAPLFECGEVPAPGIRIGGTIVIDGAELDRTSVDLQPFFVERNVAESEFYLRIFGKAAFVLQFQCDGIELRTFVAPRLDVR